MVLGQLTHEEERVLEFRVSIFVQCANIVQGCQQVSQIRTLSLLF